MDAVLLLASLSLTKYLAPTCCVPPSNNENVDVFGGAASSSTTTTTGGRKGNLVSFQIVIGLSFILLSLSVAECTPSSWLLLFTDESSGSTLQQSSSSSSSNNNNNDGRIPIATAYCVVLSALCACVLVIFPAVVGVHLVPQKIMTDKPDENDNSTSADNRRGLFGFLSSPPLWFKTLRVCAQVGTLVLRVIFWLSLVFWRLLGLCRRCLYRTRDNATMLPLTVTQQQSQLLQQKRRFRYLSGRLLGATFLILAWWTALRSLTPLVMHINYHHTLAGKSVPFLTYAVSWLCAVGFLLSAILNGFGSVSFPFTSLSPIYLKLVTPESVAAAESELDLLQSSLSERYWKLNEQPGSFLLAGIRMQTLATSGSGTAATPGAGATTTSTTTSRSLSGSGGNAVRSSWRAGVGKSQSFSELGEEVAQQRSLATNEIAFLESLIEDTKEDLEEMRFAQQLAVQARTPMGKLRSSLGVVMSVVLLLRLVTAMISLNAWSLPSSSHPNHRLADMSTASLLPLQIEPVLAQAPRTDIVTVLLLWMMGHTNLVTTQQQLNNLSQFISLLLTAFFSVSQVRFFLQTASAVNRRLFSLYSKCYCYKNKNSYNQKTPSSTGSLLASTVYSSMLSSLAACYFLACVILTKMMLPEVCSTSLAKALGGTITEVFWIRSYTVNATFCLSALVSAAILGMLFGIQKQNTYRYSSWAATSSPTATTTAANATLLNASTSTISNKATTSGTVASSNEFLIERNRSYEERI